jgi:hypothetical protein
MLRAALLSVVAAAALASCGGGSRQRDVAAPRPHQEKPVPLPRRARCPRTAVNCSAARGTVIYVERVDPDGDGDAHLVLAGTESITGPGITAIDVERGLRPHPLPRIGDRVSAAGPVYHGSYGQRQIQATVLHVARISRR